ncbi:MAG: mechanosensitive ion channel family protein [Bacteroidales bacterium]|nr:mechanosensitive ion channel family protein [Bacteroidales bacterium]
MKKKLLTIVFAVLVFSIPLLSVVNGQALSDVLKDLRSELKMVYAQRTEEQAQFQKNYDREHKRMVDVITASNELSILLYTQEQDMTFDLAYALNKVSSAYKDFSKDRKPYDRIVKSLDVEIDRYARLIEALRRLPPVMTEIEIEIVPDSLLYHNDSLDQSFFDIATTLEKEVIRIAIKDSLSSPFVLDGDGEIYRDTCIRYASELLKMHANNRAAMVADSTHYQAAYWRMQEAYDYAQSRYRELEKYVFVDGQTSFLDILANPRFYWGRVKVDLHEQYDFTEITKDEPQADSLAVTAEEPLSDAVEEEDADLFAGLSSKGANSMLVLVSAIQLVALVIFWVIVFLILLALSRIEKIKRRLPLGQLPLFSVLVGTILYFMVMGVSVHGNEYIQLNAQHINTFLWLLIAITGSLLLRVKREQVHHSLRLYIPTIIIALIIIVCRISFVPDSFINFILPPILALAVVRQLAFSIAESGKATSVDSALGWISLAIYVISFSFSFIGYTFVALLILVWWYFQLAALLSIFCIADLLGRYKERWLDKRVEAMRQRITYVKGQDRESLLFGATWFYDFVRDVAIPAMLLVSLPLCLHLALNVFDFEDLYYTIFHRPFVLLTDKDGYETLRISGRSIIGLALLFLALRYFNRAIHAIWQYVRYATFMRKHNRTSIRANEINLALGNSIISVLVWMSYAVVVISVWKIPTGSLGLIAGGLSAGIGLALKDIINNFIYGIQLMGGRLRVGDWIECDGIRGKVTDINYQTTLVETLRGTQVAFLNASLFGKSFTNLTRNHAYELTIVKVGVAYGTDFQRVREALEKGLEALKTKDAYGRDVVEPGYGIYIRFDDFGDSSVNVAVRQYVLVPEQIEYVYRCKELIYKILAENGITIPFPQRDVHMIADEK